MGIEISVAEPDPQQFARTMDIVRTAARKLVGADGVTFVLRIGDDVWYVEEDAATGRLWKGSRFPANACISGWVTTHNTVAVIPEIYEDPRVPHEAYRSTFVRSMCMVPVGNPAVAAIGAYWATPHVATQSELEILNALADSALIAADAAIEDERPAVASYAMADGVLTITIGASTAVERNALYSRIAADATIPVDAPTVLDISRYPEPFEAGMVNRRIRAFTTLLRAKTGSFVAVVASPKQRLHARGFQVLAEGFRLNVSIFSTVADAREWLAAMAGTRLQGRATFPGGAVEGFA